MGYPDGTKADASPGVPQVDFISVLSVALAGVALFVGFWHWLIYARGTREREQLFFALTCLGVFLAIA
jgi:hypothetical protein